jgi:hypothetical protein
MTLEVKKPCYFCGGKYEKVVMPKGMEDYTVSTAIINKVGTNEIFMSKSIAFRCQTCGNVQTFVEEEFQV